MERVNAKSVPLFRSSCWYKRARHCSTREALFVSDSHACRGDRRLFFARKLEILDRIVCWIR